LHCAGQAGIMVLCNREYFLLMFEFE
jgi:hypothetical protein